MLLNKLLNYLIITLLAFSNVIITSCSEVLIPQEKPNVILFLIDDYGYADISHEGNTQIQTPNIDRIAEQGARFTRFYQSSGACAPTRASLLTGRYHLETGVWGVHYGRDYLHRDEVTIGDVFKNADYATGAFGKWHSGKTWSYYGWNRGFDVGIHSQLYQYFDSKILFNNKLINISEPVTDVIGDQVVRFIEQNQDRPFFCYVPFQSIHEPFNCPEEIFKKYKNQGYTDHVARLYGMIEVMDKNIGKILNKTEELGLIQNTVVMFLCDDGPSPGFDLSYSNRRMNQEEKEERERGWGRKLRGGKASIWEGGSITPFYIQWKDKIEAGADYHHLSGVIDIFPTLIDLCDLDMPAHNLKIAGKSLWPILEGKEPQGWHERMYFDNSNFYQIPKEKINISEPEMHHISVHYQNYKYVKSNHQLHGRDDVEHVLFDLDQDPMEENNIIDQNPELFQKLDSAAHTWYQDIVQSGRAFKEVVYEIGNWEEGGSPIHLDGVTKLTGTVRRSAQSGFHFDNWNPSSALSFNIDAIESADYQVELIYQADPEDFGSRFSVYGNQDTAYAIITEPRRAFTDTLRLNKGQQLLTLELKSLGKSDKAVGRMRHLIIHRIPTIKDKVHLSDKGFKIISKRDSSDIYYYYPAVADFMTGNPERPGAYKVPKGENVMIAPVYEHPAEIEQVGLYLDFELIDSKTTAPYIFNLKPDLNKKYTLNLEFTFKDGTQISVYGDLEVI